MEDVSNLVTVKTSHYIITACSMVAALSWNDTLGGILKEKYPTHSSKILYSLIITLVVILLILFMPDTRSEFPVETRHKINMIELENYKKDIRRGLSTAEEHIGMLQRQIDYLQRS